MPEIPPASVEVRATGDYDAAPQPPSQDHAPRRIRPLRDAIVAGLAIVAVGASVTAVTWLGIQRTIRDATGRELTRLATVVATMIDVDRHQSITAPSHIDTPSYRAAVEPLRAVLRADPEIRYVYTFARRADGVHFVLDASPAGDHDGDGREDRAAVNELYPREQVPAALLTMLRTGRPTASREVYHDAWGCFVGGFAPLRDPRTGALVGGVGVEITGRRYEDRLSVGDRTARMMLTATLLTALAYFAVTWRVRRAAARNQASLDNAVAQLEEALAEARRANRARAQFLANMSHEIRTPMNGVIATLDLLLGAPLSPEQRSLLDTTRRSSEALLNILNDVLDLSKIEAGRMEAVRRDVDLIELVDDVASLFADRAEAAALRLRVEVGDRLPTTVHTDATRLRQVLMNLVGNAVKFTERGEVVVRVSRPSPGRIEVAVRDTGIGIAPERLAQIGTPFTQLDASFARRYQGTGLGVAISQRLVHLLDGTLTIESELGVGSTFAVQLPVAADAPMRVWPRLDGVRVHVLASPTDAERCDLAALTRQGAIVSVASPAEPLRPCDAVLAVAPADVDVQALQVLADALRGVERAVVLVPRHAMVDAAERLSTVGSARLLPLPAPLAQLLASLQGETQHACTPSLMPRTFKLDVLLVEDQAVNLKVARMMLERLGCTVTTAVNGREALDRLHERAFDVVFMDCQMPLMDGFEAVRRWRAVERSGSRTPVFALTANAFEEDRRRSIDAGMDGHITKPVRLDELRRTLLLAVLGAPTAGSARPSRARVEVSVAPAGDDVPS